MQDIFNWLIWKSLEETIEQQWLIWWRWSIKFSIRNAETVKVSCLTLNHFIRNLLQHHITWNQRITLTFTTAKSNLENGRTCNILHTHWQQLRHFYCAVILVYAMRSGDKKIDIAYGSFCEVEGSCVAVIVIEYIVGLVDAVLINFTDIYRATRSWFCWSQLTTDVSQTSTRYNSRFQCYC